MAAKRIDRRALVQTLFFGIGAAAMGRVIAACSSPAPSTLGSQRPDSPDSPEGPVTPTDQDEHVPGEGIPVNAGDDAVKVPNQVFESRVKQLEAEQKRLFNRGAFLRGDAGPMTGKENSHEPKASIVMESGKKRVFVIVNHVMGTNLLDAGGPTDAGADAAKPDASTDAGRTDAGDAGSIDAGSPVVHYITTIYLRGIVNGADTVVALWEFVSTDPAPPTVRFTIPEDVTSITPYEWCTIHGLWKGADLTL